MDFYMENMDEIEEWVKLLPSTLTILEKIVIIEQIEQNVNDSISFVNDLNEQLEALSEISEHSVSFGIDGEAMLDHKLRIMGTVFEIIDDKLGKNPD